MAKPIPLILDCNPGLDDFIALLMILAVPEKFNLLGISVSGGLLPLESTAQNALKACELAQRTETKVYAGCPRPILYTIRNPRIDINPDMLGYDLPSPSMSLQDTHAVDFLIDTLMVSSEKVTLATTGPLTNLAIAIIREPRILDNIEEIVTMGGAMTLGNFTPAAEYNFYADPEAAYIVYTCGKKITTIGNDVTHQTQASSEWLSHIETLEDCLGPIITSLLRTSTTQHLESGDAALHGPCVIAYLLNRSLFTGKDVHIEIDTSFGIGRGRSIVDWWHKRGLPSNAHVFNELNAPGFFDLTLTLLSRYGDNQRTSKGQDLQ